MKKNFKVFSILTLFLFLFIPISNVKAANQYTHMIPITRYIHKEPSGWTYFIGKNNTYNFNINGYGYFHSISYDSNDYLAYCLADGLAATNGGSGSINKGFEGLTNKYGYVITPTQQEILKNVLAVGPQYKGSNVTQFFDSAESYTLQRIFVTQIIVWEVMDGARYDLSLIHI